MKKMYVSESVGPSTRGRPPGRWRNKVKEYMCERGATKGGRAGSRKEGGFGLIEDCEVEAFLLWPPSLGTFSEGAKHQSFR